MTTSTTLTIKFVRLLLPCESSQAQRQWRQWHVTKRDCRAKRAQARLTASYPGAYLVLPTRTQLNVNRAVIGGDNGFV